MDNGYKNCDICGCTQPKLGVCPNGHTDYTGSMIVTREEIFDMYEKSCQRSSGFVSISGNIDPRDWQEMYKELQKIQYKVTRIRCFRVDLKTGKPIHEPYCECFGRCECGSDNVGSPRHADYCPKYEEK